MAPGEINCSTWGLLQRLFDHAGRDHGAEVGQGAGDGGDANPAEGGDVARVEAAGAVEVDAGLAPAPTARTDRHVDDTARRREDPPPIGR
jgi:hypothetical protein